MREDGLFALLHAAQKHPVSLRGQSLEMRLLPACEMLLLMERASGEDEFSDALNTEAAVAAASLEKDGRAVFSSTEEVLKTLSVEELHGFMEAYQSWSRRDDPGVDAPEKDIEALKKA